MEEFDAIIVGASFAGLAVASRLKGNVLLIDRKDIGTNVTSACGTLVKFLESIDCESSILQTFDTAALHTKDKEHHIPLADEFCTIDYFKFCNEYFKQSNAKFVKAEVKGVSNGFIATNNGKYKARIMVDCSGWSAVLASSIARDFVEKGKLSIAIETEIPYEDNLLRFFINDKIVENGAAWLFPAGKNSRFGVGSYGKNPKINKSLKDFVGSYGLKVGSVHGNFIPCTLREHVVGNIFLVGDSVGNVLPLTAEGIRPAIRAGIFCGDIINDILKSKITLKEGAQIYRNFCLKNKKYYNYLLKLQRRMLRPSNTRVNMIFNMLSLRQIASFALRKYEKI